MKPKAVTGTTGLSIAISSIASALGLCCFAPWVVPLFGVSGAILFARLGTYRPYFIGVATLLMAVALWGAYRSRKACAAGTGERRYLTWLNVLLVIGVLILVVAIFADQLEALLVSHRLS
ncbi:MAG TPA: hypothetical protein VNF46_01795 [Gammaproteobacteria bacterium]|nr:hypothetical protein [Gammaproteobacteria bacterium]